MSDIIKNRYIVAMEIGLKNETNGITYHDLVKELEKRIGKPFSVYAERTFILWFLDNFSIPNVHNSYTLENRNKNAVLFVTRKKGNTYISKSTITELDMFSDYYLNIKSFINGDAAKKYIDYLELVEARESSKTAIKKANISINIAIVTMLLSIIFSIWNILIQPKPPKQPYEVKVINQPPMNNNEIDRLKDELYKAEKLISIYENDSINQYGKVIK